MPICLFNTIILVYVNKFCFEFDIIKGFYITKLLNISYTKVNNIKTIYIINI